MAHGNEQAADQISATDAATRLDLEGARFQATVQGEINHATEKRRINSRSLPNLSRKNTNFPENLRIFHRECFREFNPVFSLLYPKMLRIDICRIVWRTYFLEGSLAKF